MMMVFDIDIGYVDVESEYSDCGETVHSDSLEITDRYRNGSISPTLSSVSKHESLSLSSKIIPEDVSIDSELSSLRNKDGSVSNGIGKCSPEESIRQKIVRSKGSLKHLCKRSSESALNKKVYHDREELRHFSHTSLNRLARENEARKTSAPDLKVYATYLSRRCSLDSVEITKLARDRIFHLGHSFHAGDKKTIEEYPIPVPNNEETSSSVKQNGGVGGRFSGIFRRRSGSSKSLGRKPTNHHSDSKSDSEGGPRLKRNASFSAIKRSNSFSNDKEVLKERDKAIEEWGRAASKCEELIEELECTLTELILIKCDRDEKEQELHNVMAFYEHNMDERDEKIHELTEQLNVAGEKIDVARRERTEAYEQRDELLQHSYKYAQEVEAMKNDGAKHNEIERNLLEQIKSFEDQVATVKSERDHAVSLWKETMEERKRVYDEQIVLAQAKDEALQKSFLQIEEINVLKTERDQLLRQIENSQLFNGHANDDKMSQRKSDSGFLSTLKMKHEESTSEHHGNDSLQLSTGRFGDDESDVISNGEEYEDIAICMDTLDSRVGWKLDNAIDAPRVMVSLVTPQAEQKWNIKKHDRILSVNSTSVQRANKKTVERLIRDAPGRTISLVLRREKPNTSGVRQYADIDLGMAKQNNFLGLQCSLQIKQVQANSELSGVEYLKDGDIITKINAQDTSEIVSSMILKLVKKWNGRATFRVKREGGFLEDKLNGTQQESLSKRSSQFQNSLFNFTLRRKSSGTSSDISTPKSSIFTDISSLFSYSSDIRNVSDDIGLEGSKEKSVSSYRSAENIPKDVINLRVNSDSSSTHAQKETNRLSITTIHNSLENINDHTSVPLRDVAVRSSLRNKLRLQSLGATIGKNFSRNWLHASAREKCVSGAVDFDDSDPNLDSPCLYQLSRYATLPRSYQRKPYGGFDGRLSTRIIRIVKDKEDPIGFDICGGNKIGIYVKNLSPASVSEGLKIGDRLMSINTTDLSKATLDFAMRVMLLHRSYTHIRVEVKHYPNFEELMQNTPYESVYVRCLQSHSARNNNEISFDVGTILHVTDTLVNFDDKAMTWAWYGERTKKNLFKDSITKGSIPWIEPYTEEAIHRTALTSSFEHLNDKRKRRTLVKTAQDLKKWLSRKPSWGKRKQGDTRMSQDISTPLVFYEILLEEQVNV